MRRDQGWIVMLVVILTKSKFNYTVQGERVQDCREVHKDEKHDECLDRMFVWIGDWTSRTCTQRPRSAAD